MPRVHDSTLHALDTPGTPNGRFRYLSLLPVLWAGCGRPEVAGEVRGVPERSSAYLYAVAASDSALSPHLGSLCSAYRDSLAVLDSVAFKQWNRDLGAELVAALATCLYLGEYSSACRREMRRPVDFSQVGRLRTILAAPLHRTRDSTVASLVLGQDASVQLVNRDGTFRISLSPHATSLFLVLAAPEEWRVARVALDSPARELVIPFDTTAFSFTWQFCDVTDVIDRRSKGTRR